MENVGAVYHRPASQHSPLVIESNKPDFLYVDRPTVPRHPEELARHHALDTPPGYDGVTNAVYFFHRSAMIFHSCESVTSEFFGVLAPTDKGARRYPQQR